MCYNERMELQELTNEAMGALGGIIVIHVLVSMLAHVRRFAYLMHIVFFLTVLAVFVSNQQMHTIWYLMVLALSAPIAAVISIARS